MTNQKPSLRFDHREIAVIFSLFVFVSLLMFTVGILVGKGLTQARYDGGLERKLGASPPHTEHAEAPEEKDAVVAAHASGSSITTETPAKETFSAEKSAAAPKMEAEDTHRPLALVPQKERSASLTGDGLLEPKSVSDSHNLLKNPKLQGLLEEDPKENRRKLASANGGIPVSYASGKYTVQVGSYATERDAKDRVEALKRLGFPNAHFSVNDLGEKRGTWYRVWLGFFPDSDAADDGGKYLQERGEVRQFLVRKADSSG